MGSKQYDETADVYDDTLNVLTYARHAEEPTFRAVMGDVRGLDVLDLGAGTGIWTRRIKRAGAGRVEGLEISASMVETARERERGERLGITYHVGDVARGHEAVEAVAFDVVTGVNVLHYSASRDELVAMCRTASRALRPGGRLVANCANYDMPADPDYYGPFGITATVPRPRAAGATVRAHTTMGGRPVDVEFYLWPPDTYESALREAGFSQVRWHPWRISPEGITQYGQDYWRRYTEHPPTLVLEAVK
ncbi:class I SAM-dependent methyltransferase [Streptomyces buecherae]|uniref:class I SAM-dependent methyltransferase n=1 Tax=Streptomyces buecherae TaxID=2763006 RepID=UPI00366A5383